MRPKIIIVLEGGLVSAVVSHDPAIVGLEVAIIDYDTDGADETEITELAQADGDTAEAIVRGDVIEAATIPAFEV